MMSNLFESKASKNCKFKISSESWVFTGVIPFYSPCISSIEPFHSTKPVFSFQIPLSMFCHQVEIRFGQRWGNIIVWASLILGQPLCIMMYYHDYVITHFGQSLLDKYGHAWSLEYSPYRFHIFFAESNLILSGINSSLRMAF